MTRCSIIIPVYNKAHLTRQCLDRVLKEPPKCSFEIIVADDGSSDGTQTLLAGYGNQIRVVTHPRNKGFATTCNDGAAAARGEYVLFLNNDTVPFPGWLDTLVEYIQARPQVGMVGSKLLYPNGTIQHAGVAICQDLWPRHIYVGLPADHPAVNKARRMQAVTGACMLLPRELFQRLGGFDTVFINCYEDIDLCLRLDALGYEIHYCPQSCLIHFESVSEGRHDKEIYSGDIFMRRWKHKLRPDDLRYYTEDGLFRITYDSTSLVFELSPEVGLVKKKAEFREIEKLLCQRSQQVQTLLRENVLLRAAASGTLATITSSAN